MPLDLSELRDYLRMNRADPALVAWVQAELDQGTLLHDGAGTAPAIAYDDCELLLSGMLQLVTSALAPVEQTDVDQFLQLCEQLGFDDAWIDGFVVQTLSISLEALTALAWLRLPMRATADQIHSAHRRMAKLYHPDRVTHLAEEFQVLARTRTRQLNRAKEILLEVSRPPTPTDDVLLEPDWEDQPTDLDGVTEALEPLPDEG